LKAEIQGDLEVDQHHTIEDCGIVLGQLFYKILEPFKGINRTGFFGFPMDDAFTISAVDFSGRMGLQFIARFKRRYCGDFDTDLTYIFFEGLARGAQANIVIKVMNGTNDHHILESMFKSIGKSVKQAIQKVSQLKEKIPSTKGVI
jgi:imidazoleglycerol-phosphate dehydratase